MGKCDGKSVALKRLDEDEREVVRKFWRLERDYYRERERASCNRSRKSRS